MVLEHVITVPGNFNTVNVLAQNSNSKLGLRL